MLLEGKVAVVTGGGRGLGRAVAHKLCASGCHVILNYLSADADAQAAVEAMAGLPGSASAVRGDVRDADVLNALVAQALDRHGRLDVFVHNAATLPPMSALAPDLAALHAEQALALDPLLHGAALFAKVMSEHGGRVIAISGNGAHHVVPAYLAVGIAKAALESLVRYLAVELAGKGIAVNAIATSLLDKDEPNPLAHPDAVAMLAARTPAGRLTKPSDVADAVALLCADEAAWIHGQVIIVDGGLGLRA
ncbi:MAG TPA: SDR family oxidoreductase [Pseudonocardiaceae bacterium]|jgi:enoyl-[acyl-carrier protein] reductase III|nr:SDR family oxidoreductase [Pseudonocardiaceae bacterium]